MKKHTLQELRQLQALPLPEKIALTKKRIEEWVNAWGGSDKVFVSFSGGKDSTVLLHLAREVFADIKGVFYDTGLEYQELRAFVKTIDNVDIIKPKKTFKEVLNDYGYPVISKEVSKAVQLSKRYLKYREVAWRTTPMLDDVVVTEDKIWDAIKDICDQGTIPVGEGARSLAYLTGILTAKNKLDIRLYKNYKKHVPDDNTEIDRRALRSQYCFDKYLFLLEAPFNISDRCCFWLKKEPSRLYEKDTGKKRITGLMASESRLREQKWLMNGCNGYDLTKPVSNPIMFWTENDILQYIHENNLEIASIYGNVIPDCENLGCFTTDGVKRSGCVYCLYGIHLEKSPNRLERLKISHPQIYEWCMKPESEGGLGYKEKIDWLNEHGNLNIKY